VISSLNRGPRRDPGIIELPEGMSEPVLSLAEHPDGLSWEAIFGRRGRVEIEVGTGKGNTLVQLSRAAPEVDFLGVELGMKYVRLTRGRLAKAGVANARVVAAEAEWVLGRHVPEGSVAAIHVYFPDPWPKKRHAKRRLFRPGVPPLFRRCLEPGGSVRIATDHESYFAQILEVMEAEGFRPDPTADWDQGPVSAFERKYREQGRRIHRIVYR
jgi:tRNA (guanine-N7-)-methyltransferase